MQRVEHALLVVPQEQQAVAQAIASHDREGWEVAAMASFFIPVDDVRLNAAGEMVRVGQKAEPRFLITFKRPKRDTAPVTLAREPSE